MKPHFSLQAFKNREETIMSDDKICAAFPQRVVLQAESKNNVPRKFIKEKQQLESGKHLSLRNLPMQ